MYEDELFFRGKDKERKKETVKLTCFSLKAYGYCGNILARKSRKVKVQSTSHQKPKLNVNSNLCIFVIVNVNSLIVYAKSL